MGRPFIDISRMATRLANWQKAGLIRHMADYWEWGGNGHFNREHYKRVMQAKNMLKQNK